MRRILLLSVFMQTILYVACTSVSSTDKDVQGAEDEITPSVTQWHIGDYYKVGLAKGVVVSVDESGEHGLIVSLDQTSLQWSTLTSSVITGAMSVSTEDGSVNMSSIKSNFDNWVEEFPAIAWCAKKNMGDLISWYLPAKVELETMISAAALYEEVNASLKSNSGVEIGLQTGYWSSTDAGGQLAYMFSNADANPDDEESYSQIAQKTSVYGVRCVRKF